MYKGDQLKWQSARFAFERHRDRDTDTPIDYSLQLFSLPISTQVCCAKQKRLKNGNNIQRGISSSGRALDSHSIGTGIETGILQLVILYNYFHCQFQRKFVVPNRKGWRIETIFIGGLAQVVERWIRIREAPRSRHRYSNWLFFTIIFIANFNASQLCNTEKVGEQKKCSRGISSSGRALDSHSGGTGIETRILQLIIRYNYFHWQFQRKFVVPNRKG